MRLQQEGLLDALPNGGFAVKTFSERDIADAIELRGTLEGLAARLAAERGAAPVVLKEARDMLIVAQDQHWQVLDAIERREGARAESLMREHSRIAQRNLREVVQGPHLDQMPGVRLIRKR